MEIMGGEPHGCNINTFDDHRIAMAFSIMASRVPGIKIKNPQCISKSFPDFLKIMKSLK